MVLVKRPSNKPKEVAQQEKKQEIERRLMGVQEQLGQTAKKTNKKGNFFSSFTTL